MTRVVHCKREKHDVYIGRPSKWGNPFPLATPKDDALRAEVLAKYEAWIRTQPQLLASLHELRGKVLGCWCAPRACHGDVLARLADEVTPHEPPLVHRIRRPPCDAGGVVKFNASYVADLARRMTQIPVVIDPNIPLTRTVRDDEGNETTEPVLCWQIDGKLIVHPDRYEQYFKPLEKP